MKKIDDEYFHFDFIQDSERIIKPVLHSLYFKSLKFKKTLLLSDY